MAEVRYWHKADGIDELQKHYRQLADAVNAGDSAKIGGLYHEASTIVALKSGKIYPGKEGAVAFWTRVTAESKATKISFEIKNVKLITAQQFVPRLITDIGGGKRFLQATLQKIGYIGVVSFVMKGSESNGVFSGGGFHRDDCSFGFPDDEGYPF